MKLDNLRLISLYTFLFVCLCSKAAHVDTVSVRSVKMNRSIPVLIVMPEGGVASAKIPTVYLLHGFSNNYSTWLDKQPKLREWADRDQTLVVCPDGEGSWFWDSPINSQSQFETFVATELVAYIDSHYNTRVDRNSRAITGVSMGGHGSLWLSFRHKDVFGAAGSMSGGVDIRPFPESWDMYKQLGKYQENGAVWDAHTVMSLVPTLANGELALIIDCGWHDFFLDVNKQLHRSLTQQGIYHDFLTRPGGHNWVYWSNAVEYQWLFFQKFFNGYRLKVE